MTIHRIPAVDRAIQVLECLVAHGSVASLRDLTQRLSIPRSTVYRILNSLEAGGLVTREAAGAYALGARLIRLAQAVPRGFDLVTVARPIIDRLAQDAGAAVKLSVFDDGMAVVVAVAPGPGAYSLITQVGRRFPLHAGGASKVLAAFLPAGELERFQRQHLESFTERTITNREAFAKALAEIRARGWGEDTGEYAPGICSVAAPVFGPERRCVAAISIPFFNDERAARMQRLLGLTVDAAARLTDAIGGSPTPPPSRPLA